MDTAKLLISLAVIAVEIGIVVTVLLRLKRIEEKTDYTIEMFEYIVSRLEKNRNDKIITEIEKELNSR